MQRTKVVYVAGSGRSGSTVLGNILGSVEGAFCGGEIRYLWERGWRDDRLCGCGARFSACPQWAAILAEASAGRRLDPEALIEDAGRGTRIRHVPAMLIGADGWALSRLGDLPRQTAHLYSAIGKATGASLVVDTSKLPAYGYILDRLPTVDLFIVHLVRDPRAAAYSWRRKKRLSDGAATGYMQRQSPLKSAVLWDVWNLTASAFWRSSPDRYLQVRYEALMREPRIAVERILRFVGHRADLADVFPTPHTARIGVNHTVAGNPDRLRGGDLELRVDDEWMNRMRRRDRAVVTAVTGPLLRSFPQATG